MHFQQVSTTTASSASTGSLHRRYDLHIEPRRGHPIRKLNHGWEGTPGSPSSTLLPFPYSSSTEGVPSPQHPLHRPPELDGSFLKPSSGGSFSGEFPFHSDSSPQYSPHQRTNYSPGHTPPGVGPTGPSEKGPSRFFQQEGSGYRIQGREVRKGVSDRETGVGKAHKREVKKGVSVQERCAGVPSTLFVHPQVYPSSFPCTQEGATGCRGYQGQSKLVRSLSSDESERSDGEERYGTKGKSGVPGHTSGPFPPQPVPFSAGPWSYDSTSEEEEGGETEGPVHVASPATQNTAGRGSGSKLRRSLSDDSGEDDTPVCPGSSRPVGPRGAPQRGSPPEKLGRSFLEDETGSPGAYKGVRVKGPSQVKSPPTKLERKLSDDEGAQKPIKGERRRVGVRVRSPPQKKLERKLSEDEVMFDGPPTAAVGGEITSKARPAMGSPQKKLERSLSDDDEGESTGTPTKDPQQRKARSPMPSAPQTALEGMPMWPYAAPAKPREKTSQQKKVLERNLDDDDVPSAVERAVRKPVKHKVVPNSGAANSGPMRLVGNDGTSVAVRKPVKAKLPSPLAVPDNNSNSGPVKLQRDLLEDEAPLVVKQVRQVRQVKQVAGEPLSANSYKSPRRMQRDLCDDDMPRPHRPGRKQVKGALAVGVGPTSGGHQYSVLRRPAEWGATEAGPRREELRPWGTRAQQDAQGQGTTQSASASKWEGSRATED